MWDEAHTYAHRTIEVSTTQHRGLPTISDTAPSRPGLVPAVGICQKLHTVELVVVVTGISLVQRCFIDDA